MKFILFLFLNLSCLTLFGQNESNYKINEGFSSNSQTGASHALMINLEGDIEKLISNLQNDFNKKGLYVINEGPNKNLIFNNINISGLGEEKIKFSLSSISNGNKHVITVTCRGKKRKDFLMKGSESQPIIKKYLEGMLQKI